MRFIATALLASGLVLATPALAAPHGSDPHAAETHGSGDHGAGSHAADAGHEGEHGGDHGAHYLYTADADGDGTPNWLDSTDGSEPNSHFPLMGIGAHFINLLLFLGVAFYMGRRPIKDALGDRALAVKKDITESARSRDEARQRTQELGQRLDNIEAELLVLREKTEAEAAKEEAALIARANAEAERIQEAAQRSIRDEVTRARYALKRDAVDLAVQLAEETLKGRMTADNQQRLARDFLDTIKSDGENRV